jgi:hypothetical protein
MHVYIKTNPIVISAKFYWNQIMHDHSNWLCAPKKRCFLCVDSGKHYKYLSIFFCVITKLTKEGLFRAFFVFPTWFVNIFLFFLAASSKDFQWFFSVTSCTNLLCNIMWKISFYLNKFVDKHVETMFIHVCFVCFFLSSYKSTKSILI